MENSKNWTNGRRGNNKEPTRGGRGQKRRGKGSQQYPKHTRFDKGEKQFPKFVDNDHMNNEANYRPQHDWNCNNRNNNFVDNGSAIGAGIYPWIRKKPANPLLMPHHINFEGHDEYQDKPSESKQIAPTPVEQPSTSQKANKEINIDNNGNDPLSTIDVSEHTEKPKISEAINVPVKIKQERSLMINLKQEKKSSSSSSSSSSESSSSKEDSEKHKKLTAATKPDAKVSSNVQSSPLNIKLKPKLIPEHSSSSSSSEAPTQPPLKSDTQAVKIDNLQNKKKDHKSKTTKKKNSSEDDVVCIGNLENKIVLEDEEDENEKAETISNDSKKSNKKAVVDMCMICDKKGHTSFQCQMICKNCSAPHHGYRTCPQPANLNTTIQLFIEFCMQQFQNFIVEKQIAAIPSDSISKQQVDSKHSSNVSKKSNKHKRKQVKASEINTKTKVSKKRKISTSKKSASKVDSDDSSDNEDNDADDSETTSDDSEESISDSTSESLVPSKRKRKLKSKTAAKTAINLSQFGGNPVNLPMVLNGFPNITVPTASIHNTNTSTSALNTLLLTQMLQNVIGSIHK